LVRVAGAVKAFVMAREWSADGCQVLHERRQFLPQNRVLMNQRPFRLAQSVRRFLPSLDQLPRHADQADVVNEALISRVCFWVGDKSASAAMAWHMAATRRAWLPRVG
jgi:hypothetical protein